MDNIIKITLKEKEKEGERYKVEFESNPTIYELSTASLILEEILDHNFYKGDILDAKNKMYQRIGDIEEILRI